MLLDLAVGALVAVVGGPVFFFLLREAHRSAPRVVVPATLMVVVAVVVSADLIREDAGLVAAVALGMVVAIFGTVLVYGLTAAPLARRLGVAGKGRTLVLIVGGHRWAREIGAALSGCGVAVRLWVGPSADQTAARDAGLAADRGRIMVDAISREAELEEVTDALLLTRGDDFNAVCAAQLRNDLGHSHVYRVAPDSDEPDLLPPSRETGILGDRSLTVAELDWRFDRGGQIEIRRGSPPLDAGSRDAFPLFAVTSEGRLRLAADGRPPRIDPDDAVIVLAAHRKGAQ